MGDRLGQLDFLRGLALFGVIVVHTSQSFSPFVYDLSWRLSQVDPLFLGRYGVQLFFAVSGYTMVMMYGRYQESWADPVRVFYTKRILRLYPLFVIAAFAYIPLGLGANERFNPGGYDVMDFVRALTFTGGIEPNYLNTVVPGGWSIVDEIYFYLIFPFLFLTFGRVNAWVVGTVIAMLNVALVAFADDLYGSFTTEFLVRDFLYRNFLTNLVCFYAGIEAYRFLKSRSWDFMGIAVPLLIVGVGLEVLEARGLVYSQVLKVTGLAVLFWALTILAFRVPWFSNPIVEKFGTVTYTGYIIHFAVIHLTKEAMVAGGLDSLARFEIVIVPITVATALISYALVPWTEKIWQRIANDLCNRHFDRRPSAPLPGASAPAAAALGEGAQRQW